MFLNGGKIDQKWTLGGLKINRRIATIDFQPSQSTLDWFCCIFSIIFWEYFRKGSLGVRMWSLAWNEWKGISQNTEKNVTRENWFAKTERKVQLQRFLHQKRKYRNLQAQRNRTLLREKIRNKISQKSCSDSDLSPIKTRSLSPPSQIPLSPFYHFKGSSKH